MSSDFLETHSAHTQPPPEQPSDDATEEGASRNFPTFAGSVGRQHDQRVSGVAKNALLWAAIAAILGIVLLGIYFVIALKFIAEG